jgi:hypothetical protein
MPYLFRRSCIECDRQISRYERSDTALEAWKTDLGKKALDLGLIKDPQWLDRLDDQMPVWAVLELALRMMEKLDPPFMSYD